MDDTARFFGIFGHHQGRSTYGGRLRIRDAAFIADLKARVSDLAARANRTHGGDWLIDFSPVATDDLTERSLFRATLTSARHGDREMRFAVGRDWVEMAGAAMESSVRTDIRNLGDALDSAFTRAVLRGPDRRVAPTPAVAVSP